MEMNGGAKVEKILVSVRLRPLNEKEIAKNDDCDWECIGENTITIKTTLSERSLFPTAYTYDRVFGFDCDTRKVYDEGAKEVILSVVRGINSTVFAYGQTSSGKTYTMNGITEYAAADIYNYIETHKIREFVLKFSAMEIYNEAVKDLLTAENTALRLLDDPEKGTVVERLTEHVLRDRNHLLELISLCAAQRKIGETSLNETSSRSHQILRLTIESSVREFQGLGSSSTLAASVNFVDLAGSERASQTLSTGARLKEGSHINRSLLTLGTVIRKLSKGKKGHVPYRDSKLTRILQNSLGGNSRTAIICTLSPARSHIEQSRNALFFASCAKEVTTNAKVNVVVSDKTLVKQLKKELAKMENELKSLTLKPTPFDSSSSQLLKEKERIIEEMSREINELRKQRDFAESRIESILGTFEEERVSRPELMSENIIINEASDLVCLGQSQSLRVCSEEELCEETINSTKTGKYIGQSQRAVSEEELRVETIESTMTNQKRESEESYEENEPSDLSPLSQERSYKALKQKIREMQNTINCLVNLYPQEESPYYSESGMSSSRGLNLSRSRSCKAILTTRPSIGLKESPYHGNLYFPGAEIESSPASVQSFRWKTPWSNHSTNNIGNLSRKDSISSMSTSFDIDCNKESDTEESKSQDVPIRKLIEDDSTAADLNSPMRATEKTSETNNGEDLFSGAQDVRRKLVKAKSGATTEKVSRKQGRASVLSALPDGYAYKEFDSEDSLSLLNFSVKDKSMENHVYENSEQESDFEKHGSLAFDFERRRQEIINLWDSCHVPLVHRTYFFLLFKGEPSDSVYFEVELRRLSFLKETFAFGGSERRGWQNDTPASSLKTLNREREMLSKQVHRKFTKKEREAHYRKWGIDLSTKQRSLQLARRIWSDTRQLEHLRESALLVARLVDFVEDGQFAKETLFGLSFAPQTPTRKPFVWKHTLSSLS